MVVPFPVPGRVRGHPVLVDQLPEVDVVRHRQVFGPDVLVWTPTTPPVSRGAGGRVGALGSGRPCRRTAGSYTTASCRRGIYAAGVRCREQW